MSDSENNSRCHMSGKPIPEASNPVDSRHLEGEALINVQSFHCPACKRVLEAASLPGVGHVFPTHSVA